MVSRFQLIPTGREGAVRLLRRGAIAQVLGVLVLSVALFAREPLLLVVVIPVGALLMAFGFLAWLWSVVWADAG